MRGFFARMRLRINRRKWKKIRVFLSLGICTLFLVVTISVRILISREMLIFLDMDFWVVNHGDTDHVSGLMYILENYEMFNINIDCTLMAGYEGHTEKLEEIRLLLEENGVDTIYLDAEAKIEDGNAEIVCCYSDKGFVADSTNDAFLALEYNLL